LSRVCCRSPIVPVRPNYSSELLSASVNGSLPRSSGASGSAPDLSRGGSPAAQAPAASRADSRASPVTDVWTNPSYFFSPDSSLTPTPSRFDGSCTPATASAAALAARYGRGGHGGSLWSPSPGVKAAAVAAALSAVDTAMVAVSGLNSTRSLYSFTQYHQHLDVTF
jgi:hypothetical protein